MRIYCRCSSALPPMILRTKVGAKSVKERTFIEFG